LVAKVNLLKLTINILMLFYLRTKRLSVKRFVLSKDSFAYRDPVGRYKRSIFDHFKPKK